MKKVIILEHNGGRLANQLWLYVSVAGYCFEKGYQLENYSFFEYASYFNFKPKDKIIDLLFFRSYIFFKPLSLLTKHIHQNLYSKIFRKYYDCYSSTSKIIHRKNLIVSRSEEGVTYLPPTGSAGENFIEFDNSQKQTLYLSGWLFRNPVGILKRREEIVKLFRPKEEYWNKANDIVKDLKSRFQQVIGLHIRQGDYKSSYRNGELYFSEKEIKKILTEFLVEFNFNEKETCFLICSDGKINEEEFTGFNIMISKNDSITDLFTLSLTDMIIGSDSTFGSFASYYGNIPLIVLKKEPIDWEYYSDKKNYFENKYLTTTHF